MYGLTGEMGSGKTTVSDYLVKHYGFDEMAFANPIKQIAIIMGFRHIDVYGTQKDKMLINPNMGISGREFMQKFGTEGMREMMPAILPNLDLGYFGSPWIKILDNQIKNRMEEGLMNPVVISDVRFLNEADYLLNNHNCLIRIIRPSENRNCEHKSESELSEIEASLTIVNDGSLQDLYAKIDKLFGDTFDKVPSINISKEF
jgi:hypothetical protein